MRRAISGCGSSHDDSRAEQRCEERESAPRRQGGAGRREIGERERAIERGITREQECERNGGRERRLQAGGRALSTGDARDRLTCTRFTDTIR
jgi:hypothetical protein